MPGTALAPSASAPLWGAARALTWWSGRAHVSFVSLGSRRPLVPWRGRDRHPMCDRDLWDVPSARTPLALTPDGGRGATQMRGPSEQELAYSRSARWPHPRGHSPMGLLSRPHCSCGVGALTSGSLEARSKLWPATGWSLSVHSCPWSGHLEGHAGTRQEAQQRGP